MPTERHRRFRAERPRTPVMWTPPALNARLEAQNALRMLPQRPWGISAEALHEIRRIIAQVERRALTQRAAMTQLRDLTTRLDQQHRLELSRRAARDRQLLRPGLAR